MIIDEVSKPPQPSTFSYKSLIAFVIISLPLSFLIGLELYPPRLLIGSILGSTMGLILLPFILTMVIKYIFKLLFKVPFANRTFFLIQLFFWIICVMGQFAQIGQKQTSAKSKQESEVRLK
jgi:hypothetical protein